MSKVLDSKLNKNDSKEQELWALRHTAEHVLHTAMQNLYPKLKKAMGPATDDGFYFDFDLDKKISEEDFPKIEKEMQRLVNNDLLLKQKHITVAEAKKKFKNNEYKLDWINRITKRGEKISTYQMGEEDLDICSGPHVKSSGEIKAFKLLSVAGAYWHGDEKNKMLTRIYGTAFPTKKELNEYLEQQEEAKKRDHRKLGQELDLFSFHPAAPADIFWHHKGYQIFKELYKYWQEIHVRENYQEVRTPEILTRSTWDQSGHTSFFIEKMYKIITPDARKWNMAIKPMNCDGGILIYKSNIRSYREFPLKMAEFGVVHRYESSGETHGILRPREFTQDDAHIYCTPEQVKDELKKIIDLCFEVYKTFGLELDHLELSTRPEKSIGSDDVWERAESIMLQVLKENDYPYKINEGDGAFYGPKFDFHLKDAIGRTWQCSTIQLDFAQPENFNLEYINKEGAKEQPVMIHRVLYGSVERFLGILIEHFAGNFPTWLTPVQVKVLPITEKQLKYAQSIVDKLKAENIRVELDERDEPLGAKIRNAQLEKVSYMLIVGEKEEKNKTVSERGKSGKDYGEVKLDKFIKSIKKEIEEKIIN